MMRHHYEPCHQELLHYLQKKKKKKKKKKMFWYAGLKGFSQQCITRPILYTSHVLAVCSLNYQI